MVKVWTFERDVLCILPKCDTLSCGSFCITRYATIVRPHAPVSIWSHLHRFYWQLKARPKYGCKMFFSSCTSLTISVALLPPFEENTLAQAALVSSMSCTSRYSGRSLTHRQTMTWQSPLQLTRRQIKAFIFLRTSGRESCDDKFHQFLIGSYATQLLGPFHQCGEQATITPITLTNWVGGLPNQ